MADNFERMIQLADEFFSAKDDPDQISMSGGEREKLQRLHPACISQATDENGPIAWLLLVPTTADLMHRFVRKELNERELLERTPLEGSYDAVYLCSALVLPEHRRKGVARRLAEDALRRIRSDHPITALFYWAFSEEGRSLAEAIAADAALPLLERPS